METFVIALVVAGLVAIPVGLIILIFAHLRLRRRTLALEAQVQAMARRGPVADGAKAAASASEAKVSEASVGEASVGEATDSADPTIQAPVVDDPSAVPAPMPWDRPGQDATTPKAPLTPTPEKPKTAGPPSEPRGPSPIMVFSKWAQDNWFYLLSALSLALAGIFLVQYGIESGLLTPAVRIAMALVLGGALLTAGEVIRRRSGDGPEVTTAYLPSTFSGAGIVTLYGAVLGARVLYDLIGPEVAFAALVVVSLISLLFGWFYGPFLAAIGLVCGAAAPFLVGGSADDLTFFYVYFGFLGATGLAIAGLRRWNWLSFLALAAGVVPGGMLYLDDHNVAAFGGLLTLLALASLCLPRMEMWPAHAGPTTTETLLRGGMPQGHKALAAIAVLVASLALAVLPDGNVAEVLLAAGLLSVLVYALSVWAMDARGLSDLALLPGVALVVLAARQGIVHGALTRAVPVEPTVTETLEGPVSTTVPGAVTMLILLGALCTLAYAWRSGWAGRAQGVASQAESEPESETEPEVTGAGKRASLRLLQRPFAWSPIWAAAAALLAPALAVVIELFWRGPLFFGQMSWALHVIALAALMTLLTERFAAKDGPEDRRRMAYALLSALSLIALALFILLTKSALTIALAVVIVVAAALDRRFRLPEMSLFLAAGVVTLNWRLIFDPGLGHSIDAPLFEMIATYGAALGGLAAALRLLPRQDRPLARVFAESGFWTLGGIFVSLLLYRWIDAYAGNTPFLTHWSAAILGMIWGALAAAQIYRLRLGGVLRWLRWGLAGVYTFVAFAFMVASIWTFNPLFELSERIVGPLVFDTLLVAYGLPGLLLLALGLKVLPKGRLRKPILLTGAFYVAFWVALEIRRFWMGDVHLNRGTSDPELYTYTIALLLLGGGLLYQAIASRSADLRRVAVLVIAATVAKVFLIDASGLTGLLRVFSFLALGLSLAGLAWLNRWAADRLAEVDAEASADAPAPETGDPPPPE